MRKQLPHLDELVVEQKKVVEYLMNLDHPDGASKAKFFIGLGFVSDQPNLLVDALCEHGRVREVSEKHKTALGEKFVVSCTIKTPNGRNPCIRTVWVTESDKPPRLVTAYPEKK